MAYVGDRTESELEETLHSSFANSPVHQLRLKYVPPLPPALEDMTSLRIEESTEGNFANIHTPALAKELTKLFPNTYGGNLVKLTKSEKKVTRPLTIGVVLSGGQAPGGHNVIAGLFDGLKKLNKKSELIGFRDGPGGLVKNKYVRITAGLIDRYRNTGGFDMIGSGRTKIETPKQFEQSKNTADAHNLDGLIVIGGDDSNTNAALLAEYFMQAKSRCKVIGAPKTIDGDLSNDFVEISFGYDTCCKVYSHEIGNIARDARSATKYWFFIKIMGRSASHITLECALATRPNVALISEEIEKQGKSLKQIVSELADVVAQRSALRRDYGMVLIPEGLIEFIPEFKQLILDLNRLLSTAVSQTVLSVLKKADQKIDYIESLLTGASRDCYSVLPIEIQIQLILDRDPHGNVCVSQIETEKLLGQMVQVELAARHAKGEYKHKNFDPRYHFCGYQGRATFPSNFDAKYCYALGHVASSLIDAGRTGYLACVRHLAQPTSKWEPCGVPLTGLMNIEERHGENKPVIRKALVELEGKKFKLFAENRSHWVVQDAYRYPGAIQFFGPEEVTEEANYHVRSFL